jgi:hypothetical protein
MPQFAQAKSDVSALAQTHARLKAWWTGEAAAPVSVASVQAEDGESPAVVAADSDASAMQVRVQAALWAHGRTFPGTQALDAQIVDELGATEPGRIALFGGGAGALANLIGLELAGKVDCFEADPTLRNILDTHLQKTKFAKRFAVHAFNGTPGALPKSKVDAALFLFQGGAAGALEACAFGAERILKPHGNALWFDFFAEQDDETLDACRGQEGRRFESGDAAQSAFAACGLTCVADDDWSARFLDAFQLSWRDLSANLAVRQNVLLQQGGQRAGHAALDHIMTWKARLDALRSGHLRIRRYRLKA